MLEKDEHHITGTSDFAVHVCTKHIGIPQLNCDSKEFSDYHVAMVLIDSGSTAKRERVYKVLSELQSIPNFMVWFYNDSLIFCRL